MIPDYGFSKNYSSRENYIEDLTKLSASKWFTSLKIDRDGEIKEIGFWETVAEKLKAWFRGEVDHTNRTYVQLRTMQFIQYGKEKGFLPEEDQQIMTLAKRVGLTPDKSSGKVDTSKDARHHFFELHKAEFERLQQDELKLYQEENENGSAQQELGDGQQELEGRGEDHSQEHSKQSNPPQPVEPTPKAGPIPHPAQPERSRAELEIPPKSDRQSGQEELGQEKQELEGGEDRSTEHQQQTEQEQPPVQAQGETELQTTQSPKKDGLPFLEQEKAKETEEIEVELQKPDFQIEVKKFFQDLESEATTQQHAHELQDLDVQPVELKDKKADVPSREYKILTCGTYEPDTLDEAGLGSARRFIYRFFQKLDSNQKEFNEEKLRNKYLSKIEKLEFKNAYSLLTSAYLMCKVKAGIATHNFDRENYLAKAEVIRKHLETLISQNQEAFLATVSNNERQEFHFSLNQPLPEAFTEEIKHIAQPLTQVDSVVQDEESESSWKSLAKTAAVIGGAALAAIGIGLGAYTLYNSSTGSEQAKSETKAAILKPIDPYIIQEALGTRVSETLPYNSTHLFLGYNVKFGDSQTPAKGDFQTPIDVFDISVVPKGATSIRFSEKPTEPLNPAAIGFATLVTVGVAGAAYLSRRKDEKNDGGLTTTETVDGGEKELGGAGAPGNKDNLEANRIKQSFNVEICTQCGVIETKAGLRLSSEVGNDRVDSTKFAFAEPNNLVKNPDSLLTYLKTNSVVLHEPGSKVAIIYYPPVISGDEENSTLTIITADSPETIENLIEVWMEKSPPLSKEDLLKLAPYIEDFETNIYEEKFGYKTPSDKEDLRYILLTQSEGFPSNINIVGSRLPDVWFGMTNDAHDRTVYIMTSTTVASSTTSHEEKEKEKETGNRVKPPVGSDFETMETLTVHEMVKAYIGVIELKGDYSHYDVTNQNPLRLKKSKKTTQLENLDLNVLQTNIVKASGEKFDINSFISKRSVVIRSPTHPVVFIFDASLKPAGKLTIIENNRGDENGLKAFESLKKATATKREKEEEKKILVKPELGRDQNH